MESIQQKGGSVRWYVLGVLVAIELLMSFSFLGYIHVEPISVTFAYIPVLLAGALLGPLEATLVGTVFGLASMWKASAYYVMDFDQLFSPFLSGRPLESFLLSVGARTLFGLVVGMLYLAGRKSRFSGLWVGVVSYLGQTIHALLVYTALFVLFPETGYRPENALSDLIGMGNITENLIAAAFVLIFWRVTRSKLWKQFQFQLETARKVVLSAGVDLTAARKEAAVVLEQRIQAELRDLDMHKVRFAIDFGEKEPGPDGCDAVRFLMSANAGEDLKPIARIASGGELARIMLALKNVLAEQESIGTLVFDEVDTGVSGRAAQKVAEKLAQVSRRKQVLCVTHLPQLAAMADTHFSVEKGERDGRTYTRVVLLDREQRKAELARITGGSHVTEALLASAGELLDQAERYRSELGMKN